MGRRRITPQCSTDIGPGTDDRTQYHESKRQERETGHGTPEPENLAVGNEDDGQVFEDGVGWDGDVLEGFGGGKDHDDQETGYGRPYVSGTVDKESSRAKMGKRGNRDVRGVRGVRI